MELADGARMAGARPEFLVAAAHVAAEEMPPVVCLGHGLAIERQVSDGGDHTVAFRRTP